MKKLKIMERKFAVPSSAALLAIASDGMHLGFDFKVLVLVNACAIAYSLIQTIHDIAEMKYSVVEADEVK